MIFEGGFCFRSIHPYFRLSLMGFQAVPLVHHGNAHFIVMMAINPTATFVRLRQSLLSFNLSGYSSSKKNCNIPAHFR